MSIKLNKIKRLEHSLKSSLEKEHLFVKVKNTNAYDLYKSLGESFSVMTENCDNSVDSVAQNDYNKYVAYKNIVTKEMMKHLINNCKHTINKEGVCSNNNKVNIQIDDEFKFRTEREEKLYQIQKLKESRISEKSGLNAQRVRACSVPNSFHLKDNENDNFINSEKILIDETKTFSVNKVCKNLKEVKINQINSNANKSHEKERLINQGKKDNEYNNKIFLIDHNNVSDNSNKEKIVTALVEGNLILIN